MYSESAGNPTVDWSVVRSEFKILVAEEEKLREDLETSTFDHIINGVAEISLIKAQAYAKRLGADTVSSVEGHAFVNGKHMNIDDVRLKRFNNGILWLTLACRTSCDTCK